MEESLDKVEEGGQEWTVMMAEFYERFSQWMALAKEPPADAARVTAVLAMLAQVTQWAPPVQRGKRTYSDEKFVESVRAQLAEGKKAVSERQLEALARTAVRHREQIPNGEARLCAAGFAGLVEEERQAPPHELVLRKFELLRQVAMEEGQRRFIDSLAQQQASGRRLSPAQMGALDRVLQRSAAVIPNFEQECRALGIALQPETLETDLQSGPLLEVFSKIATWREPVKRGKMTYDDKAFYESLARQYQMRRSLSPRQRYALGKMIFRYRDQIPDFDATLLRLGLRKAKDQPPAGNTDAAAAPAAEGAP
jgi:hypothetical protein